MKKWIAVLFANLIIAQENIAQGIEFTSDLSWQEIQSKARQEKKYIFLDLFATWCGPCKQMDANVFSLPIVGDAFNKDFINVKVQMDKTQNDDHYIQSWYKDAETIAKQYNIPGYPTYLFLSPEGDLVNRVVGAKSPQEIMQERLYALQEGSHYPILLKEYEEHELAKTSYPILARLALKLEKYDVIPSIVNDYIKLLKPEERFIVDNLKFIAAFSTRSGDPGFSFLLDNADRINRSVKDKEDRKFIQDKVDDVIYNEEVILPSAKDKPMSFEQLKSNLRKYGKRGEAIYKQRVEPIMINNEIIVPLAKQGGKIDWLAVEKKLTARYGDNGTKAAWSTIAYDHYANKRISEFVKIKNKIINKYPALIDAFTKNNDAWFVFQNAKDTDTLSLQSALHWSKSLVEDNPEDGSYLDTYANLLYRLGKRKIALHYQKEAVAKDPASKELAENYNKMQQGLPTWNVQQKN